MWTSRPDGGPGRLLTLADGVFAIAITLLVLDLYVPRGLDAAQYDQALRRLLPDLAAYALSVTVLGSFWHDHRRIFRDVREVDGQVITLSIAGLVPRQATFARQGAASGACSRRAGRKSSYWTYLGFRPVRRECVPGVATGRTLPAGALGVAALVPFPTRLLAEYGDRPVSVAVYAGAVAAMGAGHLALAAVLARRPWLRDGTRSEAGTTLYLVDSATLVVVFAATVPLALIMGSHAMWLWLVLVPVRFLLGRRLQRQV